MILQFKQQAVIKSFFVKNYKNMRKEKLIKITIIRQFSMEKYRVWAKSE